MKRSLSASAALALALALGCGIGCQRARLDDPSTVVMAIENSPTNLDPRVGTDAMSERIGGLIFDALVKKDDHYRMQPWLAAAWEQPDPLTWIFHLRDGVRFHDGRPLEAEDAAWTINSLVNGSLITSKAGAFTNIAAAEARDRLILAVHMKRPDASLLFNLSDGLFGVVPRSAGKDLGRAPIGSGPFRFVSQRQDDSVVLERNPSYWGGADGEGPPQLQRVRFAVIPDAVTVALELEKGSVDIASNQLTLDMVHALQGRKGIAIETGIGSPVMYLNFNVARAPLNDVRIRQAIAFAIDRAALIHGAWRDQARLAATLLPLGHWAAASPAQLAAYPHDPARAQALLDSAGCKPGNDGVRLRLEMKISTDETTRLLAEILQQQLAAAGIALTLRSSEFGTFYSDVTSGRFEMYALRWIGSNEDPDIFRYAFASDRVPPQGGNRGHYSNPRLDRLLAAAAAAQSVESEVPSADDTLRRAYFIEAQQILAADLPAIPLWYPNNEVVHTTRLHTITPRSDGSFAFLRTASLQ